MFGKFLRKRKKAKEKKAPPPKPKAKPLPQKESSKIKTTPSKTRILTAEGWLRLKLKKKI